MGLEGLLDVLKKIRKENPSLNKRMTEAGALARWEAAVGPTISKHSRAIRVKEGVLWVEVDHPIWKSELHHRKRQILDILNEVKESNPPQSPQEILKDLLFLDPNRKKR